jgi:hypothetical protein
MPTRAIRRRVSPVHLVGTVAVLAALLLAGCGDGSPSTTTTTSGGSTSTTVPVVRYEQPSTVKLVGTGFVDGTSRDGSAAYVEEEDPRFPQPGCEGQPEPVLFRLPLAGGERELIGSGEDRLHGRVLHGPGDRVAIVSGCEDFFTALWVGTETPDGHMNGLRKVAVADVGEGQTLAPGSVAWATDGRSLLAGVNGVVSGTAGRVVAIDAESGALAPVFDAGGTTGVSQVAQLADGSFVVAGGGTVSIRDALGAVKSETLGNGFEPATDLQSVVVYGDELLLLAPKAQRPIRLSPGQTGKQYTSAAASPDGRAVVYNFSDTGGTNEITLLTVADTKKYKLAGPAPLGRVFFSGDGRAVVFNQFRPAPDFAADVGVVRFPV